MDDSKKFIKMCEEAWKYLKRELQIRDIVYSPNRKLLCRVSCTFEPLEKVKLITVLLDKPTIIEANDFFIIWQQDQLQGIVSHILTDIRFPDNPTGAYMYHLKKFEEKVPFQVFDSMEQLWLAFVKYEKDQKIWDDEKGEWIDV